MAKTLNHAKEAVFLDDSKMNDQTEENKLINIDEKEHKPFHINANAFQMAMINKMLPKGFKFDVWDVVLRQMEVHHKKIAGLANYHNRKPEIQNELKTQKFINKFMQRKQKEELKLKQQ
jgi:hypothetical protein